MTLRTYHGSCHCGRVRFEIDTALTYVSQCNCSICAKKGILHHRVPEARFRLLAGVDVLAEYRFNTGAARHFFCTTCGIHPFTRPRSHPDQYTANVRCLDDFDLDDERNTASLEWRRFDGRNWEQAVKALR